MLGRVIAMSCLWASAGLAAEPVPLKGSTIKGMVGAGATIELDTPLGTKVPIHFAPDGQMRGEAGAVASYLGAATDTGRWWISGNKLCQQWTRWLEGQKQCLSLQQNGRQILWQSDEGKSGTATVTIKHEQTAMAEAPPAYRLGMVEEPPPKTTPRATPHASEVEAFVMTAPKTQPPAKPAQAQVAAATPPKAAPPAVKQENAKPAAPSVAVSTASPPAAPARMAATAPPPPPPPPAYSAPPAMAPTFMVVGVRASDVLNVRAGPSSDHPQVGTIPPESRGVRVTGRCAGGWCPVEHQGHAGWVNSLYLAEEMGGGRF